MNPLEARWREETPLMLVALALSETFGFDEKTAFAVAKVSLNTLADNVDERMTTAYLSTRVSNTTTHNINALSIAAAIRAAGEE